MHIRVLFFCGTVKHCSSESWDRELHANERLFSQTGVQVAGFFAAVAVHPYVPVKADIMLLIRDPAACYVVYKSVISSVGTLWRVGVKQAN